MFVTTLIKRKSFKEYLLKHFPKPETELTPKLFVTNGNPSLTGTLFETLFKLTNTKVHDFDKRFFDELEIAIANIEKVRNWKEGGMNSIFCLSENQFNCADEYFLANHVKRKWGNRNKGFRSIEITDRRLTTFDALEDGGLKYEQAEFRLYSLTGKMILYDMCSVAAYYEQVIAKFKIASKVFIETGFLNKRFVRLLLQFSDIGSIHFRFSSCLKNINFESEYLNCMVKHLKEFNDKCKIKGQRFEHQPDVSHDGVRARPDFIVNSKIIEIKSSQLFFPQIDYLQGICYLLMSQNKQSVKRYGKITSIIIYYSLHNKHVELKIKDLKVTNYFLIQFRKQLLLECSNMKAEAFSI
ncbi:MAG: hypothetical protein V4717_22260 [Bacteroidota bacterium]